MYEQLSDIELVLHFKTEKDKEKIFKVIVGRYQKRLYWHIRKLVIVHEDSDDILQNTFVKAWRFLQDFREESELFTWLYKISTNEALSFLNKKRTKFLIPLHDVNKELMKVIDDKSEFSGDEIEAKLQKAILLLPDKQRVVFNLKYFEDMPYDDISKILGTSVGALKASFHHAVKKIEKHILGN